MNLNGKSAIFTGAASGIGHAVGQSLVVSHGWFMQ
jgi:NAD(P)-dependent dehydrogenase (short-subunit alcohol dehydrogenase family)